MNSVILDTDMGVDCDDAAALGLLLNEQKQGKCKIAAITASTTRKGAVATINTILKYYHEPEIPVGVLKGEPLACDSVNNYALAVLEKYQESDEAQDATNLLRFTLANAKEKMDVIAVGPLTNIKNLLQSQADGISPLSGIELVRQKVRKLYLMGGVFAENYQNGGKIFTEWNIEQDIQAARYVAEYFPCEMLYSPFEIGQRVKTKMQNSDNPVWFCMKSFAIAGGNDYQPVFYRSSWDPVTCLVATREESELFSYSPYGTIRIDEKGYTHFIKDSGEAGKHRFMLVNDRLPEVERLINESIEKR